MDAWLQLGGIKGYIDARNAANENVLNADFVKKAK